MGTPAVVRTARAEDADAIARVQVDTWRVAYRGLMPDETIAAFDVERFYRLAGWEHDGSKIDAFQGVEVAELRYRKPLY